MNFGSKLLLIALTTMHLHTEVNKSLFLPLPLPLIEGFYQNMYLRIIYCIEKQKVKLFGSRLLMTQSILHDNIHTDRLLNTILLPTKK